MSEQKMSPLGKAVSCHAWSADGKQVALCPNSEEVVIYETNGSEDLGKWTKKYTLSEHTGVVSAIDWNHKTGELVTCGHDRNAYVWKYEAKEDTYNPTLVILRINRAATHVKWSPEGNKFAVASGARCVPVCHFEESNNWWVSKMIKKHKSTVNQVDWCPNNKFLITGSTDNKCRVFSAFIEELDNPEDDGFGAIWEDANDFGSVLAEFDVTRAWIDAVAWSADGFRMAFAGHGSTMHFVQLTLEQQPIVQTVRHTGLPFRDIQFLDNNTVVAVGFDYNPAIFKASGSEAAPEWNFSHFVDKAEEKKTAVKKPAFAAARAAFSNAASKGTKVGAMTKETKVNTKHQNTINSVVLYPGGGFTTDSLDGRIYFWKP